MSKLVIDRRTWYRGQGSAESRLQRSEDGCRCCLGFYCLQLAGFPESEIVDKTSPQELDDGVKITALHELLFFNEEDDQQYVDSSLTGELIDINDYELGAPHQYEQFKIATEQERERLITEKFASIGVEVEFIN